MWATLSDAGNSNMKQTREAGLRWARSHLVEPWGLCQGCPSTPQCFYDGQWQNQAQTFTSNWLISKQKTYNYTFCLAMWFLQPHTHCTKACKHKLRFQRTLFMVTQLFTAQVKAGPQINPAPFTPTLQSKKSVSRAPRYSTSLLTPLSPPTQLLAATLCPHHCQCHCHNHTQHAPTLLLTFPLTKRGPWSFSCWLFWDMAVERVKALLSRSRKPPWLCPVQQPTATRLHSPDLLF